MATRLESDLWPALRGYWHPVAYAAEVRTRSRSRSRCSASASSSRGSATDWRASATSACIAPPRCRWAGSTRASSSAPTTAGATRARGVHAHPRAARRGGRSRPGARVERFACEERYGLVWVCPGDPAVPHPRVRRVRATRPSPPSSCRPLPGRRAPRAPPRTPWTPPTSRGSTRTSSARATTRTSPTIDIEEAGEELRYALVDLPNPMHPAPHRRVYRLHRPFTIHQRKVRTGDDDVEVRFKPPARTPRRRAPCSSSSAGTSRSRRRRS